MTINNLPRGVLIRIFHQYTFFDAQNPYQIPSIVILASVCRLWRQIASTTPEFWDNIRVMFKHLKDPIGWASRWLQLSFPLGISVYLEVDVNPQNLTSPTQGTAHEYPANGVVNGGFDGSPESEMVIRAQLHGVLRQLVEEKNMHRLFRLQIMANHSLKLVPPDALFPLQNVDAPNLRELEVSFMQKAHDVQQRVIMLIPTAPSSTSPSSARPNNVVTSIPYPFRSIPHLTSLAIQGLPRIPYPLRNLTSLLLTNILPTETAFQSLAKLSPALHTLILNNLHASIHDGGHEVVSQIEFPNLQRLIVGYARDPFVPTEHQYPDRHFQVLPYVVAPMMEEMEIGYAIIPLHTVPDLTRLAPNALNIATGLGGGTGLRVRLDYSNLVVSDWSVKESLMGDYFVNLDGSGVPVDCVEIALPRRPDTGLSRIVRVDCKEKGSLREKVEDAFQ